MICDSIYVQTKRLKGENDSDPALNVSIESRDSLFILTPGELNHPGTITRLRLRSDKTWSTISQRKTLETIVGELISNPPFEIEIIEKNKKTSKTKLDLKTVKLDVLEKPNNWEAERYTDCVSVFELELGSEEAGFIGKAKVVVIEADGDFVPTYATAKKEIQIEESRYPLLNSIRYGSNCLETYFVGIKVNKSFDIENDSL